MRGALDASIIGTLLFDDRGAAELSGWIEDNLTQAIGSNFAWGEVIGALGVKVRATGMRPEHARLLIEDFAASVDRWDRIDVVAQDIDNAIESIADLTLALRLPDAIHIVVARRIGATLITSDRQQLRAAIQLGVSAINPLEQST